MTQRDRFLRLVSDSGIDEERLERWWRATTDLPDDAPLERLARAFRASEMERPEDGLGLSGKALEHLRGRLKDDWLGRAIELDVASGEVLRNPAGMTASTDRIVASLLALRDPADMGVAGMLREFVPEWRALTEGEGLRARGEHQESTDAPLLDHLCDGTFDRALRSIETGDRAFFPSSSLSQAAFLQHRAAYERLQSAGLMRAVRGVLLFLDFSKGGSRGQRAKWVADGVDLTVHNTASRDIVRASRRLEAFEGFDEPGALPLAHALIAAHGTTGQTVRGEMTLIALVAVANELRIAAESLTVGRTFDESVTLTCDALHLLNVCDTAAVRDDLWDDDLAASFQKLERQLEAMIRAPTTQAEAWKLERGPFESDRAWLAERILRLRAGRIADGEPKAATIRALEALPDDDVAQFVDAFRFTQIWYGEAATSALRPSSQLKVLALGVRAAEVDEELHHLDLSPLMRSMNRGDRASDYRVRLIDAVLDSRHFSEIWRDGATMGPLVTFVSTIGGEDAAGLDLALSEEAAALMTLLPLYETRDSAAFHQTLKQMCDLYGLRKDEFDRIANEGTYLQHMNSARSDKERMLDWCLPGEIIEVGPGGGVVLDLLEERFPGSRIVGIDISSMVCEALRSRKIDEGHEWHVVEADAFELPRHVRKGGASTVVFCSVLHEIYSYLPHPRGSSGPLFRLESVRDLVCAAWRALETGGRIVIRDGVMPPEGERQIHFKDPEGPEFLELFADQFEGRSIEFEWVDEGVAQLSSADAMEFLYCYTWGPKSFPYEVREQYGVLPYDDYVDAICDWVDSIGGNARVVELPAADRSYLQPGYESGLAPKVELTDEQGRRVPLPDSNCLIVIEKLR